MNFIFVDKSKETVKKICNCDSEDISKYLKVDDFTYRKIEDTDTTITEGEIYFGLQVHHSSLAAINALVAYIPGFGTAYWELIDTFDLRKSMIYLMDQESPLEISDDAIVIINRRGKTDYEMSFQ